MKLQGESGFELIELILVSVLLGILVTGAYVTVASSLKSFRLDAAASHIISDLRYAQHLAKTHNDWYGMQFIGNPTNEYHVYRTDGVVDADVINPSNPAATLRVRVPHEYKGVIISAVDIGGGNKVEYNPLCEPYTDRTGSTLASPGTITLSLDGSSKVVRIINITGRAELQ